MRAKSPCCRQLSFKLAIRIIAVITGMAAAGVTVITGIVITNGVTVAGTAMIMATIVAGIKTVAVAALRKVIARAGTIVTIIVAEGAAIMDVGMVAVTAIDANDLKMGAKAPIFYYSNSITAIDSFYPG
jgi:hypothetical protein